MLKTDLDSRRASRRGRQWLLLLAIGATAAAMLGACANGNHANHQRRLADTGRPAIHAVHSERLRQIMTNLNSNMFKQMPQEMDAAQLRAGELSDVARTAAAMADAARYIPEVLPEAKLAEQEQTLFLSLAEKLRAQAIELEQTASRGEAAAAGNLMDSLLATCNACHSAFRDLPKVPGS